MARRIGSGWPVAVVFFVMLWSSGCGRFFLSEEASQSPAVAANDGFGPAPSTASVWVELIAPDFVGVVGKAFDGIDSTVADAAIVELLSPPIEVIDVDPLFGPLSVVSGLDVVRIDGGFFVVWAEFSGPMWGQFTDLSLSPIGSPIELLASTPVPARAQGRLDLTVYFVDYADRVVVFIDEGADLSYVVVNTAERELSTVATLPGPIPWSDVSFNPNPNRLPFMVSYLAPEGDLNAPFRVQAAFLAFNPIADLLSVQCIADVSGRSTNDFNNVAGDTHPFNVRYVVYDERDGDIFGAFVNDRCDVSPEFLLGSRNINDTTGNTITRSFFPMDVRFDSNGNGLLALKQAVPAQGVVGGVTFIVSVLPLEFDGFVISGGAMRPIGLPRRFGDPYTNRTFELRSDFEAFKLVFDEAEIDSDRLPVPGTWGVLFNALDANGDTLGSRRR